MNPSSNLLMLLAITSALAGCGGGHAGAVADSASAQTAADPLDDLAANAAPNEAVMPPGVPFEEEAEFPAAARVPDAS
jgi:hypothetical protein